ncbi:MAG: BlaI/MecI/CopY family transcriptional regulator [Armatimonadetes bacterium]|nr:BlaI/MecI/CopY family transcriptional regulator [Armatimonadota bacterium]
MRRRKKSNGPTQAELEILNHLWERGPSTVKDLHEEVKKTSEVGYTTVLKFLQIMLTKGLVTRNEDERPHVYQAKASSEESKTNLLKDMVERAFGGSTKALLMHALGTQSVSSEELAEIRKEIEAMEKD